MSILIDRRTLLRGVGVLLASALAGCGTSETEQAPQAGGAEGSEPQARTPQAGGAPASGSQTSDSTQAHDGVQAHDSAQSNSAASTGQEETAMKIQVTINDVPFTATIEDTAAGQELLARLPLTLSMGELHGNEKYCYTDDSFGGEAYVPDTIEAGDLMVFGSDCLVLFYETFANSGWSYARVGRIDDPSGLAEACGTGTATVAFSSAD